MVARVILLQLASLTCVFAVPLVGTILEDVNTAVVVRDKREPGRSMTFSGFMPGRGLSAFATSGDFSPYHGYGRRPWGQGEAPAEPSTEEHPPERGQSPWQQEDKKDEEEEEEAPTPRPTKKGRKKYSPKETRDEDEEEYEKPSRGGGGNAAASFNAWFPIMLGMFPSSFPGGEEGGYSRGYPQGHGTSYNPGHGGHPGSQGGQGGYGGSRYPQGGSHTTVIANSVSNGRSGVASSHAIAYGGEGPSRNPQHR